MICNYTPLIFRGVVDGGSGSRASWDLVNKLLNRKTAEANIINNVKIEDQDITGDDNIANSLNSSFANIGNKLASKIPTNDINPMQFIQPCRSEFNLKTMAKADLIQIIGKIKVNKAPGLDRTTN